MDSGSARSRLASLQTGHLVGRLVGHSESIETVAFSPDGALLAVAGGNQAGGGEIQLWDVAHRALVKSIPATIDTVFGLSFSSDGKKIAIGAADDSVRVYSVPGGKQLIKFDNHSDWVFGTAFMSDNKHLVSASRDQALKLILLEGDSGSFEDDINTHHSPIRCLVRLPKEDKVLCAGDDGVVRLYQVFRTTARTMNQEDHNLLREFDALPAPVTALAVSPDGSLVAAGDLAGNLRVFRVRDGRTMGSSKIYNGGIFSLAFHPDGERIAVGGFDGRIRIIIPSGQVLRQFIPVPLAVQEARQSRPSGDRPRS
ncbi:MAG: WD40 repeat domain-containing protein [Chloroflexi bacterium]|nr:WD40 repeat domain-containing protein [Chloroflexota bacterium]